LSTTGGRALSTIAAISGLYDVIVGALLFFGRTLMATWFGVPLPVPPIHADLNAIFVTSVGIGYWWPYRDPVRHRGYLWVMGPGLKGAGAAAFILDYLLRDAPASFLLFAACDGTLAVATLAGLLATRASRPTAGVGSNTSELPAR
jgi:hypothetical protein